MIYISHRLEELPPIADRVTVLRDGDTIATRDDGRRQPRAADPDDGRARAVGGLPEAHGAARRRRARAARRRLRGGGRARRRPDASARARSSGWPGSSARDGRSWRATSSASRRPTRARSCCAGSRCAIGSPGRRDRASASPTCPEDRRRHGVVLEMPVSDERHARRARQPVARSARSTSAASASSPPTTRGGSASRRASIRVAVSTLSGGNQQKVALAAGC